MCLVCINTWRMQMFILYDGFSRSCTENCQYKLIPSCHYAHYISTHDTGNGMSFGDIPKSIYTSNTCMMNLSPVRHTEQAIELIMDYICPTHGCVIVAVNSEEKYDIRPNPSAVFQAQLRVCLDTAQWVYYPITWVNKQKRACAYTDVLCFWLDPNSAVCKWLFRLLVRQCLMRPGLNCDKQTS